MIGRLGFFSFQEADFCDARTKTNESPWLIKRFGRPVEGNVNQLNRYV